MDAALIQIRDTQEAAWNQYAAGWKRWEAWTRMMLGPIADAIILGLDLRGNERALDLATGAGEPGISIAKLLPQGSMTGIDISERMLDVAIASAKDANTRNYTTLHADASELPFADQSFDAVSCRHGFMFFPDMQLAASEAVRVLRPGGRLAISFWSVPEKNSWAYAVMQSVRKHTGDHRERQHLFRCSAPGSMRQIFEAAGLSNIQEEIVAHSVQFGSAQSYWRHFTNVVMPVAKAIAETDSETQRAIRLDVFQSLEKFKTPEGHLELPFEAIVLSGGREGFGD